MKPVASWVAEGAGSDKQKKTTGSITFSYYKLRCAISMSFETTGQTYPMFEAQFVQNVADAMVKAKEQAIVSGTGSGQPKEHPDQRQWRKARISRSPRETALPIRT